RICHVTVLVCWPRRDTKSKQEASRGNEANPRRRCQQLGPHVIGNGVEHPARFVVPSKVDPCGGELFDESRVRRKIVSVGRFEATLLLCQVAKSRIVDKRRFPPSSSLLVVLIHDPLRPPRGI